MKKIGVLLAGCGVMDGSEIHEAVATFLGICKHGGEIVAIAPDIEQMHVINHVTSEQEQEKRNVLKESARIARGNIKKLSEIDPADIDGLILPGGFGAAKNLCDFAIKGENCSINKDVEDFLLKIHNQGKPIGALCIAPVIIAKVFGHKGVQVTIGNDKQTAEIIERFGAKHIECKADEICVDKENKIVTTPAYMLAQKICEVFEGAEKVAKTVIEMS